MSFATRADLLARANAQKLAQLAIPADFVFPDDAQALRQVIEDDSVLDHLPDDEREALFLALDAIDKALADADALLMSYGIPADVQTSLLARLAATVAYYYLCNIDHLTDEIKDAYEAVLDILNKFAKGEIALVPETPPEGDTGDVALIDSAPRRYR
ncbi:MAG: DUF1320 family protein [Zoogloeaceae bacterium]|jgi:phage gp36-like protein|nr:DUF1320 family protein [Zoogloeaceae bacterium]